MFSKSFKQLQTSSKHIHKHFSKNTHKHLHKSSTHFQISSHTFPKHIFKNLQISSKIFKLSSRIGVTFKNEEWPRNGYPSHGSECRPLNCLSIFAENQFSATRGPLKKQTNTFSKCFHKASNNFKHLQNIFTHIFPGTYTKITNLQNTSKNLHAFPKKSSKIFKHLQKSLNYLHA